MMTHLSNPAFSTPPLELVGDIHTIPDAIQVLRQACAQYGFRHFSVVSLPNAVSQATHTIAELSIISSWPPELSAEYDRLQLARNSPIIDELQNTIAPVLIDIKMLNQGLPSQKHIAANQLFSRFELTMGVSFPIHDTNGLRYAVCFLGDRELMSDEELSTLAMFSTMLIEQISRIFADNPGKKTLLSAREIEILQWTAEGKTSAEISQITKLSEHTVNHYATIATKKLGCSNRTQAVVKVMRMGLVK
ncbi:MAG: LuxR C-terminal-related transcriptional regulator [Hoeflea sp.]|uniref:helix-turn-helix transcriptional regulator n=1 Tax=Hoeflea sp. TaxID=1940281 RepID=UPI003EF6BA93